jgi:hypothetical protein
MEELTKNVANLNMAHDQQNLTEPRILKVSEELTKPGRTLKINCDEPGKGRILKMYTDHGE